MRAEDGSDEVIAVHGGFVEVSNDRVTVLSDVAEVSSQIDVERARAAQERAEAAAAPSDDVEAEAALRRAAVRLEAATGAAAARRPLTGRPVASARTLAMGRSRRAGCSSVLLGACRPAGRLGVPAPWPAATAFTRVGGTGHGELRVGSVTVTVTRDSDAADSSIAGEHRRRVRRRGGDLRAGRASAMSFGTGETLEGPDGQHDRGLDRRAERDDSAPA